MSRERLAYCTSCDHITFCKRPLLLVAILFLLANKGCWRCIVCGECIAAEDMCDA